MEPRSPYTLNETSVATVQPAARRIRTTWFDDRRVVGVEEAVEAPRRST
jgi:hypothetical protein